MKKLIYLLIIISFGSCSVSQRCPTTDKKYFFRNVKPSRSIYKGYPAKKYNTSWIKLKKL